jgi:hypothetical protein
VTKQQRATDKLNVALSGIESCLIILSQGVDDNERKKLVASARRWTDDAHAALVMIQSHLRQL